MAIKQRKSKKNFKDNLKKSAKRLKCCYCEAQESCIYKARKERDEERGLMTFCTMTPNEAKKKKKKKASVQKS